MEWGKLSAKDMQQIVGIALIVLALAVATLVYLVFRLDSKLNDLSYSLDNQYTLTSYELERAVEDGTQSTLNLVGGVNSKLDDIQSAIEDLR